jgi:tRNA threonylcarbamoyladenosine biosynthesis protein TsaE
MKSTRTTRSAEETVACACKFAGSLRRGDIVALYGELGSGKTQFVKGVCRGLNTGSEATSPSFVVLNRYSGRDEKGEELLIFHFDLYRIKSPDELYDLGYEEYFNGDGICLIEWADILEKLLPQKRYEVRLAPGGEDNERVITISGSA